MVPPDALSPLIGRAEETRRLAELVGLGAQPGGAVLLGGDAGAGKSRLILELSARARLAGWRVVVGHCLDFGDSALPYVAFSEAFGRLADEEPEMTRLLVEAHPAIARLLPDQRRLADPEPSERTARAALFDAVQGALAQLARTAPLLLVVEDVHWADRSTRELLTFLFTRPFVTPISVVASYRRDDLHRRHPLRATLAEWGRLAAVNRLELGPLGDGAVRSLVGALHPEPLPEGELNAIVARSEGNPFFVEELVAAAEVGGGPLPTGLADLMLVRLDQLDDDSRLVVRAASVVGRRASHELLAQGVALDDARLDRALRAALEANVLVAAGLDGYAFRHALLAEAVYQDLLPGERTRLHATYARALAGGEAEGTAAELARHARAAHDLVTAAGASIRAGDEAMAVGGPDEGARHYELALELIADPDVAAAMAAQRGGIDEIGLVVLASAAAAAAGHPFRALALAEDHLRHLPDAAAPQDRARLLNAVASAALLTDSKLDVLAVTTEALQLVPPEPPGALRAQIMSKHALANIDRARHDDAALWAGEALRMARELDLADVAADALTTLAGLDERAGDPEASEASLDRAVAEARSAGEVAGELRGSFKLGSLHYELGRLPLALDAYRRTWERAVEVGRPWAPYGFDARAMMAIVAYVAGDWPLATRTIDVTGESPPELAAAVLAAIGMQVSAGRGDDRALELLPYLRTWWERDGLIAVISGGAAIDLLGQRGDVAAARQVHDDLVVTVGRLWQNMGFMARIRLGALLLGHMASAAGRAGLVERTELYERGVELAARIVEVTRRRPGASGTEPAGRSRLGPESEAWLASVLAEQARLRWLSGVDSVAEGDLVGAWREAVSAFERFGHVYEVARARLRLAAILTATGRDAEAAVESARAGAVATRLDAGFLLAELPSAPAAQAVPSRRDEPLTRREGEVLALVAEGRSNREIGVQLFISTKTVSVHVSNILAKLGAAGRTEAVAVARRRGLIH